MGNEHKLDVKTVNYIIKLLDERISKYDSTSKESIALWQFKDEISNL